MRYRTLIVDHSRVFCASFERALNSIPTVNVIGSVFDGTRALDLLARRQADVVLLEMGMPKMSSVAFLHEWRKLPLPRPLVFVMSTNADPNAPEVIEALSAGAGGVLPMPRGDAWALVEALSQRLSCIVGRPHGNDGRNGTRPSVFEGSAPRMPEAMEIVVVVASTGGPAALRTFLDGLPADFDIPIAIVQHIPAGFVASLAKNLGRGRTRAVVPAADGLELVGGSVVLAPGDSHLEIVRRGAGLVCKLTDEQPECGCRPSGNYLLRSAAMATRGRMVGVCMTGMGQDGAEGMKVVWAQGGAVIVQDEASSVVWGMPSSVLDADVPAMVLPLTEIADAVARSVRRAA